MKHSFKTGLYFGLTSGVITTLGLIVGLHSGTQSRLAVLGGILTIAVADAFSDAFGIHIAQEAQRRYTPRAVWEATLTTFLTKFAMALSFVPAVLLLPLATAIVASVLWGLVVVTVLSVLLAHAQANKVWPVVGEHLALALVVVTATHYLGDWVAATLGAAD